MKLRAMVDALLKTVYPPRCAFCGGQMTAGEICCGTCRETVLPHPVVRQLKLSSGKNLQCYGFYDYIDSVRYAIHDLKFHDRKEIGTMLGTLLAAESKVHALVQTADYVAAVPISRKRRAARGYNQSELIARALAQQCGGTYAEVLEKHVHNLEQSALTRQERLENVIGVYRITNRVNLCGKSILLVDDIVTTGATLCACAEVLYQAGVAQVTAIAFAHAQLS